MNLTPYFCGVNSSLLTFAVEVHDICSVLEFCSVHFIGAKIYRQVRQFPSIKNFLRVAITVRVPLLHRNSDVRYGVGHRRCVRELTFRESSSQLLPQQTLLLLHLQVKVFFFS